MFWLHSEHLLFVLGCCLGMQLWWLCNQVVLLGFCILILLLLLNIAQHSHEDRGDPEALFGISNFHLEAPGAPDRSVYSRERLRLDQACDVITTHGYDGTRISIDHLWIQAHRAGLSAETQSNGGFSHVDASVSSSSCQASKSICSFFLRASPSGQRSLHRPTNMARNQRVAVLYWLQNVGKDTTQTDLAESTTLYGSPLPLTTRLLADHCSTFEGGLYSTQAHLDAAGYSSLSDFFNSTKKAELCGLLHPSKRAKASNNSTATSYTLTPRKTKMTKRELRLEQHRSASPEEVVTSIDPSEGLGPYPEYQAHCATASRNADKRSTSESAHVIDGVSHEVSCIRTDVSRAYVPTQSCASNERIAEIKGDEDALTKVLNTLRSQRLSTPVIVQSNQRFIGEATPAKLGPEAEAVAYPDNDVRDPEESEDTIRLISPKKRVEPSHEASSRRILELAARLNA